MHADQRWDLLADLVHARRAALRLTMKAVAAAGGPSDTLLSRIESGRWTPTRDATRTLAKLDRALRWEPGSALDILIVGEAPRELLDPPPDTSDPSSQSLTAIENELDAIRTIAQALDALPPNTRQRVLDWTHSRYTAATEPSTACQS